MAQVPYNEGVPSVLPRTEAPEDYQRINAQPAAFGAAIGSGAERLGQGATQAARTYQEVSAQQAANNFEDESNKLVYGDPSKLDADGQPDRGLLGTRGEDALTKQAEVRQQILDLRDHYKSQMDSADQQLFFNNQTSFATRRLLTTIGAHYDAQFGVYQEGVDQAAANTALNLVAQDPTDPASVAAARTKLTDAYVSLARLKYGSGASPDIIQDAQNRAQADLLERHVESLIGSNDAGNVALAGQLMQRPDAALLKGPRYDALSQKLLTKTTDLQAKGAADSALHAAYGGNLPSAGVGSTPGANPGASPELAANNFGGMRTPGVPTGGGPGTNPVGWQQFATPEAGVQGISHQLDLYAKGSPATGGQALNTLSQIVSTWAPPSENDTPALLQRAASVTGFSPDQPLDIRDPATKGKLIEMLIRNEQGGNLPAAVTPELIAKVAAATPAPAAAAPGAPAAQGIKKQLTLAGMYQHIEQMNLPIDAEFKAKALATQNYNAIEADWNRQQLLNAKLQKQQMDQAVTKYQQDAYSDTPKYTAKDVVNDPAFANDPDARTKVINFMAAPPGTGLPAAVSYRNALGLLDRIRLPDGDPNKITDRTPILDSAHQLNRSDFEFVQKQFDEVRTPGGELLARRKADFLKAVEPLIDKSNPLMGHVDESGKSQLYQFEWALDQKVDEYRKAGKNPINLLDPTQPDYMGSAAALSPFQKTLQQSLPDRTRALIGAPASAPATLTPQRQPGETVTDYMKRVGGAVMPQPAQAPVARP